MPCPGLSVMSAAHRIGEPTEGTERRTVWYTRRVPHRRRASDPIFTTVDDRYQVITQLRHRVLVRGPAGCQWSEPAGIIREAQEMGRADELEAACRRLALTAGGRLPAEQRLFLNVDVRRPQLPLEAELVGLQPERVVIEVSEERDVFDDPLVLVALQHWKRQGYMIALDDYGAGRSNLTTLLAVQPNMIKMDRSIIAGVDVKPHHRLAVQAVARLAADLGIDVVAEGIETTEQLATLREIGVRLGQGFLLGAPARDPVAAASPILTRPTTATVATGGAVLSTGPAADVHVAAFHEALFDDVPLGAYYVDLRRTILRWNSAAEAITGLSAQDVLGRRCMSSTLDHTAQDGAPLCSGACPLVRAMADGRRRHATILLRHREGHRLAVSVDAIPVRRGGKVVGAVELFRQVEQGQPRIEVGGTMPASSADALPSPGV